MKHACLLACLVLACATAAAAPESLTNDALSACVKEGIPRHDDRKRPLEEVVQVIWQECDGDHAQAVVANPVLADILKLRLRAFITRYRNSAPAPSGN